jgi:hypothetical protein
MIFNIHAIALEFSTVTITMNKQLLVLAIVAVTLYSVVAQKCVGNAIKKEGWRQTALGGAPERSKDIRYQKVCGLNYPGNDRLLYPNSPKYENEYVGNIDQCVDACYNDIYCVGVSFFSKLDPPECYLKFAMIKEPLIGPTGAGVISARISLRPNCMRSSIKYGDAIPVKNAEGLTIFSFVAKCGENIQGRDIACLANEVKTFEDCVNRCAAVPNGQCTAITFVERSPGSFDCCLKQGRFSKYDSVERSKHDSAVLYLPKTNFPKPYPNPGPTTGDKVKNIINHPFDSAKALLQQL